MAHGSLVFVVVVVAVVVVVLKFKHCGHFR